MAHVASGHESEVILGNTVKYVSPGREKAEFSWGCSGKSNKGRERQ